LAERLKTEFTGNYRLYPSVIGYRLHQFTQTISRTEEAHLHVSTAI